MIGLTTNKKARMYEGELPFIFEPKRNIMFNGDLLPPHCFNYLDSELDSVVRGKITIHEGLTLSENYYREFTFFVNPDMDAPGIGTVRVNYISDPSCGKVETKRWKVPEEATLGKYLPAGFMVRMTGNGDIIDSGRAVASFTVTGQTHLRGNLTPFNGFLERPPFDIEDNRITLVRTMIHEFIIRMECRK